MAHGLMITLLLIEVFLAEQFGRVDYHSLRLVMIIVAQIVLMITPTEL